MTIDNSSNQAAIPPMDGMENSLRQTDYLMILWRHKWILCVGLIAGLCGGYLHSTKQPPVFISMARVQLVDPTVRLKQFDDNQNQSVRDSLSDEVMVMKSKVVLTQAAEMGDLKSVTPFQGLHDEQIANWLSGCQQLVVKPSGSDPHSSVYQISFEGSDQLITQRVVQAVMDSYAAHLKSKYRDYGQETLSLIAEAKGEVVNRLEDLESKYDEFKRKSSLIFRDGHRISVHRQNADKLLSEKQDLLLKKARLDSKLLTLKDAANTNQAPEVILLTILSDAGESLRGNIESTSDPLERSLMRHPVELSRSSQVRERDLVPLEAKLEDVQRRFGSEHPSVRDIQSQVKSVRKQILEMEQNELLLAQAREAAMEQLRANAAEGGGKGLDVNQRLRFYVQALVQQSKIVDRELTLIGEQYETELASAREESAAEIQADQFERDISRQRGLYEKIVGSIDHLDIMSNAEEVRVMPLNPPEVGVQIGPIMARSLGLGGTIGFFSMGLLAMLLEWANKSYRSAEEIAEHLQLPVIAHLPITLGDAKTKKIIAETRSQMHPALCTFFQSKSLPSEAYRAIRTALYFSSQGKGQQVLQITSAVPAEGKSTISSNIAITIAQAGKSVLLIDGDLRRPQVGKLFGVDQDKGFAWLLQQALTNQTISSELLGEAICETEVPNLSVMVAGDDVDNPSELLSSDRVSTVFNELRQRFDVILVDSPPVLAVTDPCNIAPRVDGVILVIRLRRNVRPLAAQAARMLETLGVKVLGVVVNGVGSREAGDYGKSYREDGFYNRGNSYRYGYGYTYGNSYGAQQKEYAKYYQSPRSEKKKVRQQKAKAPVVTQE